MQNLNKSNLSKTSYYNDRTFVEGAKVSRITPTPYTVPAHVYYHPQYSEWANKADTGKNEQENKRLQLFKNFGGLNKILDFLRSDEALILLVLFVLIFEGNTDLILIIALGYLLIFA